MSEEMNIYQKILELRKSVPYIQKDTHDKQGVISSSVLAKVRKQMDELGILLIPSITSHNTFPKKIYGKETSIELFTEIEVRYSWVSADNPKESIQQKWYSQGLDFGEKGIGKALTYGEKYIILKTLQIPTDTDDPDTFEEKNAPKLMSIAQYKTIKKECDIQGIDVDEFISSFGLESGVTTEEEAKRFIKTIYSKIKQFVGEPE